jgi:hypothetical protein
MTEYEIARVIADNRIVAMDWYSAYWGIMLTGFFLAYVIRKLPVFVRATVFVTLFVSTLQYLVVGMMGDQGFSQLLQDLAALNSDSGFSTGITARVNAAEDGVLPIWLSLAPILVHVLNVAISFYLLLLAKWDMKG